MRLQPPAHTRHRTRIRVRLNLRFILILLATTLLVVVSSVFIRDYWINRNADGLMRLADNQYSDGNVRGAIVTASRYLKIRPLDGDAVLKLANWVEELQLESRGLLYVHHLMADFLAKRPDQAAVRRRFIELSVPLQRFQEVIDNQVPFLEKNLGDDAELLEWIIECYEGLSNLSAASQLYLKAIRSNPANPRLYAGLLQLIDGQDLSSEDLKLISQQFSSDGASARSDAGTIHENPPDDMPVDRNLLIQQILDELLAKATPEVEARIIRANFFLTRQQLDEAEQELKLGEACQSEASDLVVLQLETLLRRRELASLSDDEQGAEAAASRAIELSDRSLGMSQPDWRVGLIRGRLELEKGNPQEAERYLRRALELAESLADSRPKTVRNKLSNESMLFRVRWALTNAILPIAYGGEGDASRKALTELEQLTEKFHSSRVLPQIIDFLEARRLVARQEWLAAAKALEEVRPQLESFPDARRNIDEALLECYTHLQNPDMKVQILQRALTDDRFWHGGRIRLAQTFAEIGLEDRAIEQFRQAQNFTRLPLAALRLEVRRQLRQPPEKRTWSGLEKDLENAETLGSPNPELSGLKAEILFHQEAYDEAISVLTEARGKWPEDETLVAMQLVVLLNRSDLTTSERLERGKELLRQFAEVATVGIQLLRGELIVFENPEDSGTAILSLAANATQLPEGDRDQLYRGLAAQASRAGQLKESLSLLKRSLELQPFDIELLTQCALLTIQLDLDDEFERYRERLSRSEGIDGPNLRFVAGLADVRDFRRLAESAGDEPRRGAKEARIRLLRSAEMNLRKCLEARKSWALAHRYLGGVLTELGDVDDSLAEYRAALRYGDRSKETQLQIVGILQRQQRDEEIIEVIRQIEDDSPMLVPEEVTRIGMLAAYRSRQWDEAFTRSGRLGSSTYDDKVIRAQLLMSRRDNPEEVETLLREATEIGPENPMAWYLRVSFLMRDRRADEARAVIEETSRAVPEEPDSLRPYIQAICWEIAGDVDEANRLFQESHRSDTRNLQQLNEHVNFCLRHGRISEAQTLLALIIDSQSGLDDDLRRRAQTFSAQLRAATAADYQEFQKAIALLDGNLEPKLVSLENLRGQVQAYSRSRMRKDQIKLIRVLEELGSRNSLQFHERLQLALLYEQNARWNEAWVLYRNLIEEDPTNLSVIASFVQGGTAEKQPSTRLVSELEKAIETMMLNESDSFRTMVARVRLLAQKQHSDDGALLLESFLRKIDEGQPTEMFRELIRLRQAGRVIGVLEAAVKEGDESAAKVYSSQIQLLVNGEDDGEAIASLRRFIERRVVADAIRFEFVKLVAATFETLERYSDAEHVYQMLVDKFQSADATVILTSYYARRGQVNKALTLLNSLESKLPPPALGRVAVAVVRASKAGADDCRVVEQTLERRVRESDAVDSADKVDMLATLADLYDFQERFSEASRIYTRLLGEDQNCIVALNNLSWILSFDENIQVREKGLAMINRAIEVAGRVPQLLDTRAIVHLNLGRPKEALDDLQGALDEVATPDLWFHLAIAQFRLKNQRDARESMERATSSGFSADAIHPLERGFYAEVQQGINAPVK